MKKLQDAMLRIRYASVPVVAAVRGIALGGGCEIAIHCARRVAAMESYMGFVEVGVGLIPAGGGLTYLARRAAEMASAGNANADLLKFLTDGFTSAATAKVGTSAIESRKLGYLLWSDVIVPHKDELLHVATQQVKAMSESGWRPPAKAPFPVAGRNAIATIKAQLVNMRDGGFISAHDFHISSLIAEVVCGGDVDAGSLVSEEYLMAMERKRFCGCSITRRRRNGSWACCRPASRSATEGREHEQASARRLHRRRDAHADRPLGARLLPQHPARRSAGRGDQERDDAGARRSTRRRSRTRSSAARSRKASRA